MHDLLLDTTYSRYTLFVQFPCNLWNPRHHYTTMVNHWPERWSIGNAFVSGGRPEVRISGWLNRTQCCQQLATAATFLRKELCCRRRIDAEIGTANSLHAVA